MQGILRLGCAVPTVTVGDPLQNFKDIENKIKLAKEQGTDIILFPELSLSGYSCGDLFFHLSLICPRAFPRIIFPPSKRLFPKL